MMNKRITPEEALKRPNPTLPEIDETPPITINSLVYLGALSDPAGPRTHEYALRKPGGRIGKISENHRHDDMDLETFDDEALGEPES